LYLDKSYHIVFVWLDVCCSESGTGGPDLGLDLRPLLGFVHLIFLWLNPICFYCLWGVSCSYCMLTMIHWSFIQDAVNFLSSIPDASLFFVSQACTTTRRLSRWRKAWLAYRWFSSNPCSMPPNYRQTYVAEQTVVGELHTVNVSQLWKLCHQSKWQGTWGSKLYSPRLCITQLRLALRERRR
jgi:hypothetical protein